MTIFFTSDIHFGHEKILGFCPERGKRWSNLEDHDEAMIANWNGRVGHDDTVFFLGDFSFRKPSETVEIGKRLNGNIMFIQGNHDSFRVVKRFAPMVFDSLVFRIGKQHVAMCHRPEQVPMTGNVTFGVCGHVHQQWQVVRDEINCFTSSPDRHPDGAIKTIPVPIINVGVDVWDFAPVSFDEIQSAINQRMFS